MQEMRRRERAEERERKMKERVCFRVLYPKSEPESYLCPLTFLQEADRERRMKEKEEARERAREREEEARKRRKEDEERRAARQVRHRRIVISGFLAMRRV